MQGQCVLCGKDKASATAYDKLYAICRQRRIVNEDVAIGYALKSAHLCCCEELDVEQPAGSVMYGIRGKLKPNLVRQERKMR